MPSDTEVQQLIIYVGTQAKIDEARQAGTIGPDDFAVVTDAPDFALQSTVQAIQVLIPSSASAQNQLADKNYVDSSTLPSSTKYGASFVLSINSSDYKVTATLKDQDGNTLGTQQVIDLPLESVVVGGSYDSVNKQIILTLQNGNTIDVPVGDLVAGLQTEITSQNKLASDLVDDTNQTNKFVTSGEKTTWNNKQNAITGGATTITNTNLTENRALISNGEGKVAVSPVTNTELGYLSGSTSSIQTQLNGKANTSDVDAELDKKIDKGYAVNDFATNCITEIPQDIKLELNNGTLTLKSGSIITNPNGTQLTLTTDRSTTQTTDGKYLVCPSASGGQIQARHIENCVSGAGATTTSGFAYNTTTSKINNYSASGEIGGEYDLPVCIVTVSNGAISSIDKVFNGAGYIGHHAFVLPGISFLRANGFNSDGTLASQSYTRTTLNFLEMDTTRKVINLQNQSAVERNLGWYEIENKSQLQVNGSRQYVRDENRVYTYSSGAFVEIPRLLLVRFNYDGTTVTQFDICPVSGLSGRYINTALGYTPYDSSNPAGYTSNTGTVTSVNNVSPSSGNVTLTASNINYSGNTSVSGALDIFYEAYNSLGEEIGGSFDFSGTFYKNTYQIDEQIPLNNIDDYDTIVEAIGKTDMVVGKVSSLTTTEKSNLVGAINEINSTIGDIETALQTINSGV